MSEARERVQREVDALREEVVAFASDLVRIPTVNPPGDAYPDCARLIGNTLERCGFAVEYHEAVGKAEHTRTHPRVNVVGARAGAGKGPLVHLNGHFDVVPAGAGWTRDPFAGTLVDGRLYGRGSCDMKAGLAAAGVAHLCEIGRIQKGLTDYVIIPEPLNVDRVCVGHRGVYWFEVETFGRIA